MYFAGSPCNPLGFVVRYVILLVTVRDCFICASEYSDCHCCPCQHRHTHQFVRCLIVVCYGCGIISTNISRYTLIRESIYGMLVSKIVSNTEAGRVFGRATVSSGTYKRCEYE